MCCRPVGDVRPPLAAAGLVALVAFAGCGATDPPEAPRDDHAPPAERRGASAGGKSDIYGEDGRREYFETDSAPLREVGDATAMLVEAGDLESSDDEEAIRRVDPTSLEDERGVCERERFSQQPAPGDCTGFLVGDRTLVTAGHCVDDPARCDRTRVVFGFRYEADRDERVTRVPTDDVYRCDAILHREDRDGGPDFALLRLDRPALDRPALDFRRTGKIADGAPLAMVGHPVGLPQKVDRGGRVVDNTDEANVRYNLDTYGGNSGSAVVDPDTGLVEAVHVHGSPDFRPDLERSCLVSYRCTEVTPETRCRGNGGTRATTFAPHVLPDEPDDGIYRFSDADDRLERTESTVTAEIYVPDIGEIATLRVVTRLAAGGEARVGLRLERGTETGGESIRLLRDHVLAGKWRRDFPVAKFTGREAEGVWRIVVETDDPSRLEIGMLALDIRTQ